jgi:hypothetical protein
VIRDHLRDLMQVRGLSTDGHQVDPAVCLDCFQTRPGPCGAGPR